MNLRVRKVKNQLSKLHKTMIQWLRKCVESNGEHIHKHMLKMINTILYIILLSLCPGFFGHSVLEHKFCIPAQFECFP